MSSLSKKLSIVVGATLGITLFAVGAGTYIVNHQDKPKVVADDNWTHIVNADSGNEVFVDLNTVKYAQDRYAKVWVMINRTKPTDDGTISTKTLTYFDCADDQYKIVSGHGTDQPYGHGNSTGKIGEGEVADISPGSVISEVEQVVCKPLYDSVSLAPNNQTITREHKDI